MQQFGEIKSFLGVNIRRSEDGMFLNQSSYIENVLNRFHMSDCHPVSTPIDISVDLVPEKFEKSIVDEKPVRELIGSLTYLSMLTRADIAVAVNLIARYQNSATERHWIALKRILRYLQGTKHFGLYFEKNCTQNLIGYADSDFAGDKSDRKSTSGYVFKIYGSTVSWATKKQSSVGINLDL